VMMEGAPMTTSSTYLQASTLRLRSCKFMIGKWGPRRLWTSSSVWSPTRRKSPSALAACRRDEWNKGIVCV
jgi:hypothetical protein